MAFLSFSCRIDVTIRITNISPTVAVNRTAEGKILWNDGKEYMDHSQYAYLRDKYAVRHAVGVAIQCRCLEKLMEREK